MGWKRNQLLRIRKYVRHEADLIGIKNTSCTRIRVICGMDPSYERGGGQKKTENQRWISLMHECKKEKRDGDIWQDCAALNSTAEEGQDIHSLKAKCTFCEFEKQPSVNSSKAAVALSHCLANLKEEKRWDEMINGLDFSPFDWEPYVSKFYLLVVC